MLQQASPITSTISDFSYVYAAKRTIQGQGREKMQMWQYRTLQDILFGVPLNPRNKVM